MRKSPQKVKALSLDNHQIRFDGDLVCFNDIYSAAGSPPNQEPAKWDRLVQSRQLIDRLCENLNVQKKHIYQTRRGRNVGGTF